MNVAEKGRGVRQAILVDPDVKRWYENVSRGARSP